MKKLNVAMALCVAGTLAGTMASAGYKYVVTLNVDPVNRTAKGSLSDTRATADTVSYIGCRISTNSAGKTVYCVAQDANHVTGSCNSNAADFVAVASTLQSNSILSFSWDANGVCTGINVENWSSNTPMQP